MRFGVRRANACGGIPNGSPEELKAMIKITPMTPNVQREDLGTFKKAMIEANGAVFDALTGFALFLVILAIGLQIMARF